MLPVEKFLNEHKSSKLHPNPDRIGSFGYASMSSDKTWDYYFLFYKWENTKSHPSYYIFNNFNTLSLHENVSFLNSSVKYISWDMFFIRIQEFKNDVKTRQKVKLPQTHYELIDLAWQAFLKTQDINFAPHIKNLPDIFFQSVDESLTSAKRYDARNKFLEYMHKNLHNLYFSWINFLPDDFCDNFRLWIHNYLLDV
jgi:hypothetical protein